MNNDKEVNIENTNIIPVPEESKVILNKKLVKEDPLTPYKKLTKTKCIVFVLLFILLAGIITAIIYKYVIAK